MKKHFALSVLLKIVTVFIFIVTVLCLFLFFPVFVRDLSDSFPEFQVYMLPSLICIWASSIPCFVSLVCFWRICTRIGKDNPFCMQNAASLKLIGIMALIDTVLCFALTAVLFAGGAINPGVMMIAFMIIVFGATIAAAALALSYLVSKASLIQDENDLTI